MCYTAYIPFVSLSPALLLADWPLGSEAVCLGAVLRGADPCHPRQGTSADEEDCLLFLRLHLHLQHRPSSCKFETIEEYIYLCLFLTLSIVVCLFVFTNKIN